MPAPSPTFAEQMLAKIQTQMLAFPAGATSIEIDGQKIALADLMQQQTLWENRVAREAGTRPVVARLKLG